MSLLSFVFLCFVLHRKIRPSVHFDQTLHSTSCLIRPNIVFDEVSFDESSWIHVERSDIELVQIIIFFIKLSTKTNLAGFCYDLNDMSPAKN